MFNNRPNIGRELLDVPMGDMIRDMAFAIAEAQIKLDANSIEVAEMMGGLKTITDSNGNVTFEDSRVFFGQERVTVSDAVAMHNATSDVALKAQLKTTIGTDATGTDTLVAESTARDKMITIPTRLSMMELGFTPTFYQFVDTIIEVKMSIKYTQEATNTDETKNTNRNSGGGISFGFRRGLSVRRNVSTSQVNASYSQKYSYSAEGSSLLRTKLVPIPAPAILEERIRKLMEAAEVKAAE